MKTDEERRKLYDYMVSIGFIIQVKPFFDLKTNEEKRERFRTLLNQGYRIQRYGEELDIININGATISRETSNELKQVFKWVFGDKSE